MKADLNPIIWDEVLDICIDIDYGEIDHIDGAAKIQEVIEAHLKSDLERGMDMNEQRIREIVREEMQKKEATAVTIAPVINLSSGEFIDIVVKKIEVEIEKAVSRTQKNENLGGFKKMENTELMTQIVKLLSENGLTVKQGCDLLDKAKLQMMHHTKIGCNFENTIKEAVTFPENTIPKGE